MRTRAPVAPARTPADTETLSPWQRAVLDELHALAAEQARQRDSIAAILRLLDRGRGARDQADVALLVAIAEVFRDRRFTSGQIVAHAGAELALRDALEAADITSAQELGCVFRRLEGITLAGFRLERVGDRRAGIEWQVQVCAT